MVSLSCQEINSMILALCGFPGEGTWGGQGVLATPFDLRFISTRFLMHCTDVVFGHVSLGRPLSISLPSGFCVRICYYPTFLNYDSGTVLGKLSRVTLSPTCVLTVWLSVFCFRTVKLHCSHTHSLKTPPALKMATG